jgi:hypothetical protein
LNPADNVQEHSIGGPSHKGSQAQSDEGQDGDVTHVIERHN